MNRGQQPNISHWFTESSLGESFREGECLICSNLVHAERHAIFSFLWEATMSSMVRVQLVESGGFCARHFWLATRVEEACWPASGIGVAILCENLIGRVLGASPDAKDLQGTGPRLFFRRRTKAPVVLPSPDCMFCRDSAERKQSLIEILEYLQQKQIWKEKLDRSPRCLRDVTLALQRWERPDSKEQLRFCVEMRLRQLRADLNEFIRKHDWNHREDPLGRERGPVERAIQFLTGFERQFPQRRKQAEGGTDNGNRRR